jgi:poly [ADP-ribose] polymerase
MVTAENNNKFYNMNDNGDGTFTVEWGRVGVTSSTTVYPISKWDRMYKNKTKKGYKDVSEIYVEESEDGEDFAGIKNHAISRLVITLQNYANKSVSSNYLVTSDNVTQKQVDEAQALVDALATLKADDPEPVNDLLLEIYSIIPRRMANVKYHLFGDMSRIGSFTDENVKRLITNEQATLDVMAGQVSTNTKTKVKDSKKTLLDAMGLAIEPVDDNDMANIEIMMGPNWRQFKRAFKVINVGTQNRFDEWLQRVAHKNVKLFWHGSRNENWWSILDSGLLIRPSNAVRTGAMFGNGIYFADKAQKSIGYSSLRGSYWTGGTSNTGFLALFQVHTGNWLHAKRHESWMYSLNESKLKSKGPYDSLFAEGGYDLRNNEYIIYNLSQCTVKYLVELSG